MTKYYLVDVKSIKSNTPRSNFKVDELETLAQSILASGGLLSPLVLKQTGAETYEVLAGDLEYYAAVRAKELDPRKGEMVNAFVVPEEAQSAAIEQAALLSPTPKSTATPNQSIPAAPPAPTGDSDLRITNLESRLDEAIRDLKRSQDREINRLEQTVNDLKAHLPQRIEPLDAFNDLSLPELAQKLVSANVRGKTAERMLKGIEKEREKAKFKSFTDIVERVDGLGDKRMLAIIDTWSGLY
jgi:signal recognition particle GTPase